MDRVFLLVTRCSLTHSLHSLFPLPLPTPSSHSTQPHNSLVSATSILKQQEQIIAQNASRETSLLTEIHALRAETRTLQGVKKVSEQQLQEAQLNLDLLAKGVETEKGKSGTLQERCDELTLQLESERSLK